jgi:hypothetical protein
MAHMTTLYDGFICMRMMTLLFRRMVLVPGAMIWSVSKGYQARVMNCYELL